MLYQQLTETRQLPNHRSDRFHQLPYEDGTLRAANMISRWDHRPSLRLA